MGNSYTSKKPCSVWLVKDVGETPSTDCITDILDGEGIYVSGTKTVKVISLLPPRDGHIGGVKRKEVPDNAVEIDPETGEIFVAKSGVDFPITIEQGGTGKTNREDALLALLPDTLDQEGKVLSVYKKDDGTTGVKWIDMPNVRDYVQGDGINISDIDPETGKRTISTKVNPSEFRYNDNGVMELSDQVTNALAKADSSVQTVNNTPPDENGNVNVAGSLPVLTLISDFVGDISVLRDWLSTQPDQQSILYIKTQKLPDIQVIVSANNSLTQTWETLAYYIKTQVRALYDGCPNFTCIYNADGRLELSTNDILNPIEMYIPTVPDNESLNVQMKLVPPSAIIVSQPYATIEQVNAIVNNAVTPLQQDIKLLNLDMLFADYYIGVSINYLLSGKWDGDEIQTYNEILTDLNDTNTLKFTLANSTDQFSCPLTITKQQFIDFGDLDTFMDYVSDQITSVYKLGDFRLSYNDNQGFMATNLDSEVGVLVCEQDNNNLAVIMKLTDLTGAKDRIYTKFSQNSLQQQIIDNKLIINDVFINKIKNGENVTIDVDPATNTATFNSSGGGSGGANRVTVTVNGQNPQSYNVDRTGNITIDVPLTTSLKSNLLNITTIQSGVNKGETELIAETTNQLSISTITKQIGLSEHTAEEIQLGASALQRINVIPNKGLQISDKVNGEQTLTGIPATATTIGMVQPDNITTDVNSQGVISSNNVPFVIEIIGGVVENKLQDIYNWLLAQPNQKANLYFPNKLVPDMVIDVNASWASTTWASFLTYIRARIQYLYPANNYPSLANFTISLNDSRLHISTNLADNPIYIYIPEDPTSLDNLNAQMRLTRFTGANIGIVTVNSNINPEVVLSYRNGNQYRGMDGKDAIALGGTSLHPIINRSDYIFYNDEFDTITFKKGYKYDLEISGIINFDASDISPNNYANYGLINMVDYNNVLVAKVKPIITDEQGAVIVNYDDPHLFAQLLTLDTINLEEDPIYRRVAYLDEPFLCNLLTLSHWTVKVLRIYE